MGVFKYIDGVIKGDVVIALEAVSDTRAYTFHMKSIAALKSLGFEVRKDVVVPNRGDGRKGLIDIIAVRGSEVLAIELDWHTPRLKSLFKIQHYKSATGRAVVCRE